MASSTGLGGYDRASLDDDLIDPDDGIEPLSRVYRAKY